MDIIARLFSLVSIPLMLLGIWGIIRQVNRQQEIKVSSPLIGLIMSPVILLFNILVLQQARLDCAGPLILATGIGFGLAWGMTMRLNLHEGRVVGRQSILHLVFWGMSYAITQFLTVIAPAAWVAGGLALMFFSTGTTLGTNLNLLVRQTRLQRSAPPQAHAPIAQSPGQRPPTLPR